ncbi:MAG: glutamine-hydrolyzing carbamoyl-phosphate synthase small subunit [Tepidanaerobacteraceae bacterium]|jgi:carbamoyl-phosphate synthase small subunit|nr:glutamine-hydrolyzing carbamoyl-phosphate synthase small subunit [Tepidanaerobacteraceae bacterium]
MKAIIALTDGTVYEGRAFGASGTAWGEVVFNTGMTGYQEILTDPSYAGQIVTLTYPLVGNYGTAEEFAESDSPKVRGFIVREAYIRGLKRYRHDSALESKFNTEISKVTKAESKNNAEGPNKWPQERKALDEYLRSSNIVAVEGIDTRSLTRKIRQHGVMKGAISTEFSGRELLDMLKEWPDVETQDLVKEVSTRKVYSRAKGAGPEVALLDLGVKRDIVESLVERGARVTVFPAQTPAEEILSGNFRGVLLSNGPGDPQKAVYAIETTRRLLGRIPIFGICLGHQVLALALGGKTYKLKFGHRGVNHPVKDLKNDTVFMTSQNHGYAVDAASIAGKAAVTFVNANDGTVEGLELSDAAAFSVQFHPEASPGPYDAAYLFDEFLKMIEKYGGTRGKIQQKGLISSCGSKS